MFLIRPLPACWWGGIAILLISLIAYYSENKWKSILKALLIVLIIKVAVSPHSPPTAYLAVTFQAVLGAFLFSNFSLKGLTLVLLGMLTFLQSALQKLITLTIIYGENLWEAVNVYGDWLMGKLGFATDTSATTLLIFAYLLFHGIAGLLAGLFIKSIINLMSSQESSRQFAIPFQKTASKKKEEKTLVPLQGFDLLERHHRHYIIGLQFFRRPVARLAKGTLYYAAQPVGADALVCGCGSVHSEIHPEVFNEKRIGVQRRHQ